MGLDAIWQQTVYTIHQVWLWMRYEVGIHPFIFLGAVIIIISAWVLYKAEVRTK